MHMPDEPLPGQLHVPALDAPARPRTPQRGHRPGHNKRRPAALVLRVHHLARLVQQPEEVECRRGYAAFVAPFSAGRGQLFPIIRVRESCSRAGRPGSQSGRGTRGIIGVKGTAWGCLLGAQLGSHGRFDVLQKHVNVPRRGGHLRLAVAWRLVGFVLLQGLAVMDQYAVRPRNLDRRGCQAAS